MKYIQSFYQYPVMFSSIEKWVPSKDADGDLRNIVEIEDKELETLERSEPMFNALISEKKYRVLNKLPESYKPSSMLLNEAREEAEAAKRELEALKAQNGGGNNVSVLTGPDEDLEKLDYKTLQGIAIKAGIEKVQGVRRPDLIKAIREAKAV